MEKLAPQLEKLDIQYERFSAVDGKQLGIDPIVAGLQSHLQVMKQIAGQKVLILEDDAQFVEDFNEKFEKVMQTLPEDYMHLHNWMDETKGWVGNSNHRIFRHHSEGIFQKLILILTVKNLDMLQNLISRKKRRLLK